MATGKSTPPSRPGKKAGTKGPAAKAPAKSTAAKSASAKASAKALASAAPKKKQGKSIVNQKSVPWGWIATATAIVAFAVLLIGYAVMQGNKDDKGPLPAALAIPGVQYSKEGAGHVTSGVTYDRTPPVGGSHSGIWADCHGTVYPNAIANENAVHALEHGSVWITYQPGLDAASLAKLTTRVTGENKLLLSPYPGQASKISLQSWQYQLAVDSVDDPRLTEFINLLRDNPETSPEAGLTCDNPPFKANPSTFGAPYFTQPPAPSATVTPSGSVTPTGSATATTPAGSVTTSKTP